MKTVLRSAAALGVAAALVFGVGACGKGDETEKAEKADNGAAGGTRPTVEQGFKVGLLLPENTTARYERFDKPFFEAEVDELCPKCEVQYANAGQQADTQRQQAEAMLANGVNVLVLDAVDTKAAAAIVNSAKAGNVPVIAYDRLAEGPIAGYVSFDNEAVGKVQAEATGQDAELAAIRRVISGDQDMTVFKPYQPAAATAAGMAVAAAVGEKFEDADRKKHNGTVEVDAMVLAPVPVTKDNVKDTVAKKPYYTVSEICTPEYAAACKSAGLG
ncbi:substrate-binding domain-containing protein [Yinghuangia sp. YIM S09857]|uniref:substrate-binding domain-containing protein n=1 Tax=Yinghuangia sp. YIM S09857 TaxID=3436929 RepID=UPI003F536811